MSYKFADTHVLDVIYTEAGGYSLARSEDCAERYGKGHTVRHYPGSDDVHPYMDEGSWNIDFNNLESGLADLDCFPDEDQGTLGDWLREHLS